jgi:hypothetical protein
MIASMPKVYELPNGYSRREGVGVSDITTRVPQTVRIR